MAGSKRNSEPMESRKDAPLQEAESTLSKMLREQNGELLAAAKEAVKQKVLQATVQQALEELGGPGAIAQQAFGVLSGEADPLRSAQEALRTLLLEDLARQAAGSLGSAEAAAEEAHARIEADDARLHQARRALKQRLLEDVARGSTEALADVEAAAQQAIAFLDEDDPHLLRAKQTVKELILKKVLRQAVSEIEEEVTISEADRANLSRIQVDAGEQEVPAEEQTSEQPGTPVIASAEPPPAAEPPQAAAPRPQETVSVAEEDTAEVQKPSPPAAEAFGSDGASLVAEPAPTEPVPTEPAPAEVPAAEKAAASGGETYYVYGVLDAGEALPEGALPDTGLDPNHAPYLITHEGLQAIVSRVALPDFSEAALPANLKDTEWKRTYKARHIDLLEEVAATGRTFVPRPFATLCRSEEAVQEMLAEHHDFFRSTLERLRGKHEWGIRIYGNTERLHQVVLGKTRKMDGFLGELPDVFASRIKQEMNASLQEEVAVIAESCAKYSHNMLLTLAEAFVVHASQPEDDEGLFMILNAAYLVPTAEEENFAAALDRLAAKHGEVGFTYDTTGPRPPLSFCE